MLSKIVQRWYQQTDTRHTVHRFTDSQTLDEPSADYSALNVDAPRISHNTAKFIWLLGFARLCLGLAILIAGGTRCQTNRELCTDNKDAANWLHPGKCASIYTLHYAHYTQNNVLMIRAEQTIDCSVRFGCAAACSGQLSVRTWRWVFHSACASDRKGVDRWCTITTTSAGRLNLKNPCTQTVPAQIFGRFSFWNRETEGCVLWCILYNQCIYFYVIMCVPVHVPQ